MCNGLIEVAFVRACCRMRASYLYAVLSRRNAALTVDDFSSQHKRTTEPSEPPPHGAIFANERRKTPKKPRNGNGIVICFSQDSPE